jgi:hypothetical protein
MATNDALNRGEFITLPVPIAANSGVGPISGDPLVFGRGTSPGFGLAGVAQNSETPPTGVSTGNIGVRFIGVVFLSVVAKDGIGGASLAIAPGDKIFGDGGTYDITTGCLYGFTLNGNKTSGVYFGNSLDAITGGQTATVRVRLKVAGD